LSCLCVFGIVEVGGGFDVWQPRSVGKNPRVIFYTFLAVGHQKNKTSLTNPPKKKTTRLPLLYDDQSYIILLYKFAIGQLRGFSFFRIQNPCIRYQSPRGGDP